MLSYTLFPRTVLVYFIRCLVTGLTGLSVTSVTKRVRSSSLVHVCFRRSRNAFQSNRWTSLSSQLIRKVCIIFYLQF